MAHVPARGIRFKSSMAKSLGFGLTRFVCLLFVFVLIYGILKKKIRVFMHGHIPTNAPDLADKKV